jgi:hypothetical protein
MVSIYLSIGQSTQQLLQENKNYCANICFYMRVLLYRYMLRPFFIGSSSGVFNGIFPILLQFVWKTAYNRNFPRSTSNSSHLFSLESALDKSGSKRVHYTWKVSFLSRGRTCTRDVENEFLVGIWGPEKGALTRRMYEVPQ